MSIPHSRLHWDADVVRASKLNCFRIAGVGMAKDPHSRIARENPFEASLGIFDAVRDDNHAGMLRKTNADATAVVDGNPGCASRRIAQRLEECSVSNGLGSV